MKTRYKILITALIIVGGLFLFPAVISVGSTFYCNSIYPVECVSYSISLFGGGGYDGEVQRLDGFYETEVICQDEYVKIDNKCVELIDFVFGDANKKRETSWRLYPGGAGWTLPENSPLTPIYKKVDFGMPPLDLEAMLNDKIFVDKCETVWGKWNYTYQDCEEIVDICTRSGGSVMFRDITPVCTEEICLAAKFHRISCVFEYEN